MCLACSIAFAFVILSVFVGYGIVAIPMHLWRQSSFQNEFEDSLITLANLEDRLKGYESKVKEVCIVGRAARIGSGVQNYEEMLKRRDQVREEIDEFEAEGDGLNLSD